MYARRTTIAITTKVAAPVPDPGSFLLRDELYGDPYYDMI